jgi:hypothetical protein
MEPPSLRRERNGRKPLGSFDLCLGLDKRGDMPQLCMYSTACLEMPTVLASIRQHEQTIHHR